MTKSKSQWFTYSAPQRSLWMRDIPGSAGHHIPKIEKLYEEHPELFQPGTIAHVTVRHDHWCAAYRGQDCDCEPEVLLMSEEQMREKGFV